MATDKRCTSLLDMHQAYVATAKPGKGEDVELAREVEKFSLEWCSKTGMIMTGGTALDFAIRSATGEGFYSNDRAGDIDVIASMDSFGNAMILLDEMADKHPIFSKMVADIPPFRHITDRDTESIIHRVRVGPHVVAEIGLTEGDIFSSFSSMEVDLTKIFVSRGWPATEKGGKMRVVPLESSMANYFRMVEQRCDPSLAGRLAKNIRYLWKIANLLDKHGLIPKAAPSPNDEKTAAARLASIEEELPLLEDCYYSGTSAMHILFDESERGKRIEVACFGKAREAVFTYMERYDYAAYEIKYPGNWRTSPPAIILEPSQTSKRRPLVIYDCSILCGSILSNGKVLAPFAIGGLSDPSSAPAILSFFLHRTADMQKMMATEKTVGECAIIWFIIKFGYKFKLSRPDFISNRQYVAALLAIYTKYLKTAPPPPYRKGPSEIEKK